MNYVNTYPNAYIRFYVSDNILHVDRDATYLVAPKARSRIAGYFHLLDHPNITKHPRLNGAILVECKTLRQVVSSFAESEVAGIYHNARITIPIRQTLQSLNHPQPPTPLKTDNWTATGFVYDNIQQKTIKSMGHALLLAEGPPNTTTIQHLLGERSQQRQWIIYKTSRYQITSH